MRPGSSAPPSPESSSAKTSGLCNCTSSRTAGPPSSPLDAADAMAPKSAPGAISRPKTR